MPRAIRGRRFVHAGSGETGGAQSTGGCRENIRTASQLENGEGEDGDGGAELPNNSGDIFKLHAPIVELVAPLAETAAPIKKTCAPAAEKSTPFRENRAPIHNGGAPIAEIHAPLIKSHARHQRRPA